VDEAWGGERRPISKASHVLLRDEDACLELDDAELGTLLATYQFEPFDDSLLSQMSVIMSG